MLGQLNDLLQRHNFIADFQDALLASECSGCLLRHAGLPACFREQRREEPCACLRLSLPSHHTSPLPFCPPANARPPALQCARRTYSS